MEPTRERGARWIPIAGVVAALAGLATIGVHPRWSPDGRAAIDGVLTATALCGAAVGFARYRSNGDPNPLFVAAGLAVVAVQVVVFDQHWIASDSFSPWEGTSLPAFGWFSAWVIAGLGSVLARPWWERRGRRPILAPYVFGVAGASLLAVDLVLVGLRHSLPRVKNVEIRHGGVLAHTAPAVMVLGLIVVGLLLVAAWRELSAGGDARSSNPWLMLAWTIAAAGQVVLLAHPVSFRPFVVPADALIVAAAGCALVAYLAPQPAEASRARRATDRAQEVMSGRAEIAAMISHEVRGPISTIRGLASTANTLYERLSDDERRELLGLIEQESGRLLGTVTQAATALKVDANTITYDIRPQDIGRTVREAVSAADTGAHELEIDVPEELTAPVDLKWFSEAIRQVIENAANFSSPEGSISVAVRVDEPWMTVEVTDHGPGIPPERRDEVFQKYTSWRPDGYEQTTGSGLGLFITRGIVASHGGDVTIFDAASGGTMLRIRLPREA